MDFTGALVAGTVWLAAAIVAWPWHHPVAAVVMLVAYMLLLMVPVLLEVWRSA